MKEYTVEIEDALSDFYQGIAKITKRTTEDVLEDTLQKMADYMLKGVEE